MVNENDIKGVLLTLSAKRGVWIRLVNSSLVFTIVILQAVNVSTITVNNIFGVPRHNTNPNFGMLGHLC